MKISIIGPTLSGKSVLGTALGAKYMLPVVDAGQIVRLTADPKELGTLQKGQLSDRHEWIMDTIDRAIDQNKDGMVLIGYPRTKDQMDRIRGKGFKVVAMMGDHTTLSQRGRSRGRDDDGAIETKEKYFYELLLQIFKDVDMFASTSMTTEQIIAKTEPWHVGELGYKAH